MLIDAQTTTPDYFGQRTTLEKRYPSTRSVSSVNAVQKESNNGFVIRLSAISMIVATFVYIGYSTLNMGVAVVG